MEFQIKCLTLSYIIMKSNMKTVSITLRISSDEKLKLLKIAEKNNRSLSDFIRLELQKLVKENTHQSAP